VPRSRNNHLPKHHEELSDLAVNQSFEDHGVRRIALVWDIDSHPYNKALRITSERILSRGENHQSLRPDPADQMRHEAVIRMFMSDFVPPEGGLFDDTIKLGLENSLEQNLRITADGLCDIMPQLHRPTDADITKALEEAKSYKPSVKKDLQGKETPPPRYYGLSIELDLKQYVADALVSHSSAVSDIKRDAEQFLGHLVANGRIVARPHVTIVHEKTVQEETPAEAIASSSIGPAQRLWTTCEALRKMPSPALFEFDLTALLFNDRVMTLVVDHVRPHQTAGSLREESGSQEHDSGKVDKQHLLDVERALCEDLKEVLHVTVGTREEGIQPYEARGLVEAWRRGDEGVKLVNLKGLSGVGRVMGMS
jgi:tRNA ligase